MQQIDPSDLAVERLASIAQPTRLQALRLLLSVHPDAMAAGEIARRCEVPHNTMSTHLATLTRAGLVDVAKDGRVANYRANVQGMRGIIDYLARDCCDGRPDLCGVTLRTPKLELVPLASGAIAPAFNVLFLCIHNSARSIMAEAILERIGAGRFRAYSAGSEPGQQPLPDVVDRLRQLGHDVGRLRCKSLDEFSRPDAPRMDFVIALCDSPEGQFCPDVDSQFVTAAWPLPDPTRFHGSASERTTLLNELYAMIRRRLELFVSLPFASLDRMSLKNRLDTIGDSARISS